MRSKSQRAPICSKASSSVFQPTFWQHSCRSSLSLGSANQCRLEECQCSYGQAAFGGACQPCQVGTFKDVTGNVDCTSCGLSANGFTLGHACCRCPTVCGVKPLQCLSRCMNAKCDHMALQSKNKSYWYPAIPMCEASAPRAQICQYSTQTPQVTLR